MSIEIVLNAGQTLPVGAKFARWQLVGGVEKPSNFEDIVGGYHPDYYFRDGKYLGPDEAGVEPVWVNSTDMVKDEFLRGIAESLNCDAIEAEAQWGGYSRQLSDDGIREIESGGHSRGMEIGKEISAL